MKGKIFRKGALSMDNGSSSYNRYLAGDDSAMSDLVHEYRDGLVVFLNSFTNDIF